MYTRISPPVRTRAIAVATSLLVAACGGSEGGAPTASATATVSGVVKGDAGLAIEGATVRVGSAAATTGADGRFELRSLPVGSVTLSTSAPRFDARTENVALIEGANTHDVVLTPQTTFTHQSQVAYLPPGIAEYRAAIVFLPGLRDPATGNPLDSRALVRGTFEGPCSIWCDPVVRTEVRRRALTLAGGNVALIGTQTLVDDPASYETLRHALSDFASQSLHPELANIPIVFVGHSMGGCTAYGFSRVYGARVAGFMTMKGACHTAAPAAVAATVPGYFLIGALDAPFRAENISGVFDAGRATGAPWALSVDPLGHDPIADIDLLFAWVDAVLAARLPSSSGAPLRPVTETSGWLGDRSSGVISTYACYGSTRVNASWLPSRETALAWQRMAKGTGVVGAC